MKSYTEKHNIKLNPCKYCGKTEIEIVYNKFNNQEHCVAQCKCGAYKSVKGGLSYEKSETKQQRWDKYVHGLFE